MCILVPLSSVDTFEVGSHMNRVLRPIDVDNKKYLSIERYIFFLTRLKTLIYLHDDRIY